jgi:hypothetical protein
MEEESYRKLREKYDGELMDVEMQIEELEKRYQKVWFK